MKGYLSREVETLVERKLDQNPVVAILGPRQCGKSTMAKEVAALRPGTIHVDLERPSELRKLTDPEAFFALHREVLVVLDEIQRAPDLFPVLRSVVDERGRNGQFLVLGSASEELLRQTSESLAGRIAFLELTPFLLGEVGAGRLQELLLRGGFPRSYLAADDQQSLDWRRDFVRTFLERDIGQHAARVPSERLGRFWRMCAHEHGQVLNSAKLGTALGVSGHTVRSYLELLEKTFMLRMLAPCEAHLRKRVVKSPRVFVRDSGILHALLEIRSHDDLLGHPGRGASWEGLVIEHVTAALPEWRPSFFRTSGGAELDLVLERGQRMICVECKAASAPRPTRGFWSALDDLAIREAYVVAPVAEPYPLGDRAAAMPLHEMIEWAPRINNGETHPAVRVAP